MKNLKMILLTAAFAVVAAFALTACGGAGNAPEPGKLTLGDYGVAEYNGNVMTISLESNPSTGYEWMVDIDGDTAQVTISDFAAAEEDGKEPVTGAPGTQLIVVQTSGEGTSTVALTYSRSWEPSDDDAKIAISVTTDKDGNIVEAALA